MLGLTCYFRYAAAVLFADMRAAVCASATGAKSHLGCLRQMQTFPPNHVVLVVGQVVEVLVVWYGVVPIRPLPSDIIVDFVDSPSRILGADAALPPRLPHP